MKIFGDLLGFYIDVIAGSHIITIVLDGSIDIKYEKLEKLFDLIDKNKGDLTESWNE